MASDETPERARQGAAGEPPSRNIFRRIANIKLGWFLTVLVLLAIVFYSVSFYLAQLASQQPTSTLLPFLSGLVRLFADASLSSAVIGFGYEWFIRRETDDAVSSAFRDSLSQQKDTYLANLERLIPQVLLLDRDVQKVILVAVEKLDEIMRNILSARLGDTEMGASVYEGLLQKTLEYEERYSDLRHEIVLANLPLTEPQELQKQFFDATVNLRYRTKLRATRLVFTRVTGHDSFNERIRSPEYVFTWRVRESEHLPKDSEKALKVIRCRVDDLELNQQSRVGLDGSYEIVCEHPGLQALLNKEVTIFYSVQTKLARLGHVFFSNAVRPTRHVTISFNWARTDIETVRVYDFFVSAKRPNIYLTPTDRPHTAVVELEEWVFPKGGAVFAWQLKGETSLSAQSESNVLMTGPNQ
jgi:hypothetical protein